MYFSFSLDQPPRVLKRPVEPVEPAEPVEPVETLETVEPAEPVESVEPEESVNQLLSWFHHWCFLNDL